MVNLKFNDVWVNIDEDDLNKKMVIYLIAFDDDKIYIGQTKNELHRRIAQHCSCSVISNVGKHIQITKKIHVSVLKVCMSREELNKYEKEFITMYKNYGYFLFNISYVTRIKQDIHRVNSDKKRTYNRKKYYRRDIIENVIVESQENKIEYIIVESRENKIEVYKDIYGYIFKDLKDIAKFYNTSENHINNILNDVERSEIIIIKKYKISIQEYNFIFQK